MTTSDELFPATCIACQQTDTAPKHVHVIPDGTPEGAQIHFHRDCHVQVSSCPECKFLLDQTGNKQNDELRQALSSLGPIEILHDDDGNIHTVQFVDQTAAAQAGNTPENTEG